MWNKIYLGLLVFAIVAMCGMTYWCYNWLGSVDRPETVAANLINSQNIYRTTLLISSAILMLIANILLWTKRSAWALWVTFIFFSTFIILQTWWLNSLTNNYLVANKLESGFVGMGILGIVLCIITAIGVFFNQFIVFRMRDKMFADKEVVAEISETVEKENG